MIYLLLSVLVANKNGRKQCIHWQQKIDDNLEHDMLQLILINTTTGSWTKWQNPRYLERGWQTNHLSDKQHRCRTSIIRLNSHKLETQCLKG